MEFGIISPRTSRKGIGQPDTLREDSDDGPAGNRSRID